MRSRVRHELKTWPEFFEATRRGQKKFELRRDDRPEGFQVGDELLLREFTHHDKWCKTFFGEGCDCTQTIGSYTDRTILVLVDYVVPANTVNELMDYDVGPPGFVIMSVSLVS